MRVLVGVVTLFIVIFISSVDSFSCLPPENRTNPKVEALRFRKWMTKIVDAEKTKLGGMALQIPTIVAVSQSALESYNGKSKYAKKYNNYFGLYTENRKIMKFKNPSESARYYLVNLLNHKGYEKFRQDLRQGVTSPFVLSKKVARIYAEDPRYYIKVAAIIRNDMETYGLT